MPDTKPTTKPAEIGEHDRFETVLLCDLEGDGKRLVYVQTLKWRGVVIQTRQDPEKGEVTEAMGFQVTVPRPAGTGAIKIFSHICHDQAAHADAIAFLEQDKKDKDRTDSRLPTVWNGKFNGCPLCAVNQFQRGKQE